MRYLDEIVTHYAMKKCEFISCPHTSGRIMHLRQSSPFIVTCKDGAGRQGCPEHGPNWQMAWSFGFGLLLLWWDGKVNKERSLWSWGYKPLETSVSKQALCALHILLFFGFNPMWNTRYLPSTINMLMNDELRQLLTCSLWRQLKISRTTRYTAFNEPRLP